MSSFKDASGGVKRNSKGKLLLMCIISVPDLFFPVRTRIQILCVINKKYGARSGLKGCVLRQARWFESGINR